MIESKIIFIVCALFLTIIMARHMVHNYGAVAQKASGGRIMHDYILNLIGTLLGWIALYYLIFLRPTHELSIVDFLLIFVVFIGITGYLPHMVINKGIKP